MNHLRIFRFVNEKKNESIESGIACVKIFPLLLWLLDDYATAEEVPIAKSSITN